MSEWQDISTAPKDKEIIGWNGHYVSQMRWISRPDDDGHIGWCDAGYEYGGVLYDLHYDFDPPPTHWMPLPEPPK